MDTLRPGTMWGLLLHPESSPLEAVVLLLALVGIAIAVLLALALAIIMRRGARGPDGPRDHRWIRHAPWLAPFVWLAAGGAVLMGSVSVLTASGTCLRCHRDLAGGATTRDGRQVHSEVACAACHAAPGIGGGFVLGLQTAADSYVALTGHDLALGERRPRSGGCGDCHEQGPGTVAGSLIAVDHSHFAGLPGFGCLECHGAVGHGARNEPDDSPRMSLCLHCHDDREASAACRTCHPDNVRGWATDAWRAPGVGTSVDSGTVPPTPGGAP